MLRVAILGAGELGGAVAHRLARRDAARAIHLVDSNERLATGKALDIVQSAGIEHFAARVSAQSTWDPGNAADVVVIADRVDGGEWAGEDGLTLLRRTAGASPGAVILFAGPGQRDLIERGGRELRIDRRRLAGTAPEALRAAIRALVALETNTSSRDIGLSVLGVPPSHVVVPWAEGTIAGLSATRALTEPSRRRLSSRAAALWPPGPTALAAAAVQAIECIGGRSRQTVSCFVAPDDSFGVRARAAALPVRFVRTGIAEVIVPALDARERVILENAMML